MPHRDVTDHDCGLAELFGVFTVHNHLWRRPARRYRATATARGGRLPQELADHHDALESAHSLDAWTHLQSIVRPQALGVLGRDVGDTEALTTRRTSG